MKKYLVFRNNHELGKTNVSGSPEDVACEIARFVEMEGSPRNWFIGFPAETPEATFYSIKSTPRYSIELDQEKIDTWINELEPLLEKIRDVHDTIDNAYGEILSSARELQHCMEETLKTEEVDIFDDMDIDQGFEVLSRPNEYVYSEYVAEYFDIQVFKYHPAESQ